MKIRSKPSAFYTIWVRLILTHWQLLLWLDLHFATVKNGSSSLLVGLASDAAS
jgi:hypothetical protein